MSWMYPTYTLIETPDAPIGSYKLWLYRESGWDDGLASSDASHDSMELIL